MKQTLLFLIAALLIGCSNGSLPGNSAMLQAETNGYIAEATAIQAAAESDLERLVGTVSAMEAEIVHKAAVNVALHATLQAVSPSTTRVAVNVGGAQTPVAILEGRRWFVKTGMASQVSDANGCSETPETAFTAGTARIYATFKAYNIESGTPLSASWAHNGRTVHEESFNLDRGAGEICLWFYIDPETVAFTPGLWSVQLYAEGFPLESAMPFNIG